MTFKLSPLQYDLDALQPHLSKEVVDHHYNKHTRKYFDTANELAKGTVFEKMELNEVMTRTVLMRAESTLYNNICQASNHEFYWKCLSPSSTSGAPSKQLETAIKNRFGSLNQFKDQFNDKIKTFFGSGWVWLTVRNNELRIVSLPNGGTPLTEPHTTPIMVCDVWEHAYYLQYQSNKVKYAETFWDNVNWNFVNEQYASAQENVGE